MFKNKTLISKMSVMFKAFCLSICLAVVTDGNIFQIQDITKVRNGIEKSLMYIRENYRRVNVDCLFGVVLTQAIVQDVYHNGTQLMDESSRNIIRMSKDILMQTKHLIQNNDIWVAQSILDVEIWQKDLVYRNNSLYSFSKIPKYKVLKNIYKSSDNCSSPNTNLCLQDIAYLTLPRRPRICSIKEDCWNFFYEYDDFCSGYILTHKLLLLQLAKARKCVMNKEVFEQEIKYLCSKIYEEVFSSDYYRELDNIFDLFLEEIVLCGYEGYSEFFKMGWLYYILETQKKSGCFPAVLKDERKTKIKRNTNIFEDGCADHTTGLGAAALSLYYNFIVKERFVS